MGDSFAELAAELNRLVSLMGVLEELATKSKVSREFADARRNEIEDQLIEVADLITSKRFIRLRDFGLRIIRLNKILRAKLAETRLESEFPRWAVVLPFEVGELVSVYYPELFADIPAVIARSSRGHAQWGRSYLVLDAFFDYREVGEPNIGGCLVDSNPIPLLRYLELLVHLHEHPPRATSQP